MNQKDWERKVLMEVFENLPASNEVPDFLLVLSTAMINARAQSEEVKHMDTLCSIDVSGLNEAVIDTSKLKRIYLEKG